MSLMSEFFCLSRNAHGFFSDCRKFRPREKIKQQRKTEGDGKAQDAKHSYRLEGKT